MSKHHPKTEEPELEWRGAVPVALRFDDPYFSLNGGLDETRHVFLAGNGLPDRFAPGFHIAELGFGTGLNALAALQCWQKARCKGPLHFTSFERYLMSPDDIGRALAAYPELKSLATPMLQGLARGDRRIETAELRLQIVIGDARQTLPVWGGMADAWFLDGFSPAKNPELWEAQLLSDVAAHTKPNGTAATYSAAGHVRASLKAAGFTVERRAGYGRKRHMTVAWK